MASKRRAKGTGTLFKKNNGRYALRYEDIDGCIKTVTLKNEQGNPITLRSEAEKCADKLMQELFKLQQLESKAEYLSKVASVKQLIVQKKIIVSFLQNITFFTFSYRMPMSQFIQGYSVLKKIFSTSRSSLYKSAYF